MSECLVNKTSTFYEKRSLKANKNDAATPGKEQPCSSSGYGQRELDMARQVVPLVPAFNATEPVARMSIKRFASEHHESSSEPGGLCPKN